MSRNGRMWSETRHTHTREKRRETVERTISRYRDLVAEMSLTASSSSSSSLCGASRSALRAHIIRAHRVIRVIRVYPSCTCALTHVPQVPGDAAAPVCSRCQTLWRPGVLQAILSLSLIFLSSTFVSFSFDLSPASLHPSFLVPFSNNDLFATLE